MNKTGIFLLVCFLLHVGVESAPISLDLNGSQATLFQDKKLKVLFRCTGGNGVYQYQFKNIPASWKVIGNSIIIQNFTLLRDQSWRFDVYVTDSEGNYLSQTIMISFMGFYVGFSAITMPTTGKNSPTDNYNNNPFSILPGLQSTNFANLPMPTPPDNQQARITDLVGGYPGLDNYNRLMNGYNDPSLSASTPDYISATQPATDSKVSPYTAQKQAAMRRQSQANQAVTNLAALYEKLNLAINKMKEDVRNEEIRANASRLLVTKCDEQLFSLENTKTKISNAISDKEQRLTQYQTEISKSEKQIQNQANKLASLQQDKRNIESSSLPNSKALQSLQQSLDQCRSSYTKSNAQLEDSKIKLDRTQTEIKLLTIQANQAKVKLSKLKSDLSTVRDKISNLENQLKQARNEESNMLKDINKYELIPVSNDIRIKSLQSDIRYLSNSTKSISSTMAGCQIYEDRLSNIQNIVNKDKQRYNDIAKSIQDQQVIIDRAKSSLLQLKKSSSSLPMQVSTLRTQMLTYDNNIRRTGYLCEDNITEYSKIALNLKNLNDKVDESTKQLQKTNANLRDAKNELQLANSAAGQLIKAETTYLANNKNTAPQTNTATNNQFSSNSNQQTQYTTTSSTNSIANANRPTTTTTTAPQLPKNPSDLSIDDIINSVINKKPTPSTPATSTQNTTPQPATQIQAQNLQVAAALPQVQPQAQTQVRPSQPQADFSLSSYFQPQPGQSPAQTTSTQRPPASTTPQSSSNSLPSATYQINSGGNQNTQNNQNIQNYAQPMPTAALSATSELGDEFKVASNNGFRYSDASNAQDYLLKKYKIYTGGYQLAQNRLLYTLDDASIKTITGKGGAVAARFQPFICTDTSIIDSAIIQDVGLGYILAKSNNNIQYRLTFGDCSKAASLGPSNSLKEGIRIFFTGSPLVSLPGNILLNVHLIVSNPV